MALVAGSASSPGVVRAAIAVRGDACVAAVMLMVIIIVIIVAVGRRVLGRVPRIVVVRLRRGAVAGRAGAAGTSPWVVTGILAVASRAAAGVARVAGICVTGAAAAGGATPWIMARMIIIVIVVIVL